MIDALVIGAGPTGTTAALELARRGKSVRIVDSANGPFIGSRGKGITARTQEIFHDFGIVEQLLDSDFRHLPVQAWVSGEQRSDSDPAADQRPTADRPYESTVLVPQWRTEEILRNRLAEFGVTPEYDCRTVSATTASDHVDVTLADESTIAARYVIGCDGGRSVVRSWLGARFDGTSGGIQAMMTADVHVDGLSTDRWYQWAQPDRGFVALCPFRNSATWQFQGLLWSWLGDNGDLPTPTIELLQEAIDKVVGDGVQLSDPTWLSRWRVNVRMVDRYRSDRIFLAGDAAHVHPPAGGLGMNTGIQDSYNLAWKLSAVLDGADDNLLNTYGAERIPIAENTLGVSSRGLDEITENVSSGTGTLLISPVEDGQQLLLGYRCSELSTETEGFSSRAASASLRAGDRAPNMEYAGTTLFDVFRGPHATIIVIGTNEPLPDLSEDVAVVRLSSAPVYTATDGLFVIRPDGYVGFAGVPGDASLISDYLRQMGLGT